MKILVVAPWVPGVTRPRSFGFIRHLASHHDITVVCAVWSSREEIDLQGLPGRVIPVHMDKTSAYLRCAKGLLTGRSLQQSYVNSSKMRAAIRQSIEDFRPDFGFFNVIRSAQFSNEFSTIPVAIDLDEFRSGYYDILAKSSRNLIWRLIAKLEAKRMRSAEAEVLENFQRIIVSSPRDLVGRSPKVQLVRSPYAMDPTSGATLSKTRAYKIIFVGRQSYRANAEAITWFTQQVLPEVVRHLPECNLSIVGDSPPPSLKQLEGPHVTVTGRVDDVAAYYAGADVSVIPVTMATGVQMKLIESMVMGTPVVATSIVTDGAGVDSNHCYVADSVQEWVECVVRALTDVEESQRRSDAAKRWADREHSTDVINGALDRVLSGLTKPTSRLESQNG